MTSPADIYDQALERLSATNLSDEVEDINLGGTMLQAANAKSFKQIEAEANEDARRIVRGQPKAHRLQRDYKGIGPGASITPRCDCGWSGRPCFETDGAMMSRLEAQEDAHRASILHERVFGGGAA